MFFDAPGQGVSICRSKCPNGRICHLKSTLARKNKVWKVVEDCESRPPKADTLSFGRQKQRKVAREGKLKEEEQRRTKKGAQTMGKEQFDVSHVEVERRSEWEGFFQEGGAQC